MNLSLLMVTADFLVYIYDRAVDGFDSITVKIPRNESLCWPWR